jgi:hypothetical protein
MMEHEQINDKSVALSMRCSKVTTRILAKAMLAFLRRCKKSKPKQGEQSLKSLTKQGASLEDIEISGENIGTFKKIARKHNIDFALKRDNSVGDPPKWIVFFKARDDKAFAKAFNEYAKLTNLKQQSKTGSLFDKLEKSKELTKSAPEKVIEHTKSIAGMMR